MGIFPDGRGDSTLFKEDPTAPVSQTSLNLPMFPGPFSAPFTQGALDALAGFRQLFDPTQVVSNQQVAGATQRALTGDPVFNPNSGFTLQQFAQPFRASPQSDTFLDAVFGRTPQPAGPVPFNPFFGPTPLPVGPGGPGGGGTPPGPPGGPGEPTEGGGGGGGAQEGVSSFFGGPLPVGATGAGEGTPNTLSGSPADNAALSNVAPADQVSVQQLTGAPTTFQDAFMAALGDLGGLDFGGVRDALNQAALTAAGSGFELDPRVGTDSVFGDPLQHVARALRPEGVTGTNINSNEVADFLSQFGVAGPLATRFTGLLGELAGAGLLDLGRATQTQSLQTGGTLDPNAFSIVGEQGPELIPPGNQEVIPLTDPFGPAGTGLTDQLLPQISQSFTQALDAPRFDLSETFQVGQDVFQNDLDRQLARVREEFSGLGLGPGSTDRNERLLRTAGDLTNRFRLGQLGLANEAFENAERRRLGALGLGGQVASVTDLPFQRRMQALPFQMRQDQQAIENLLRVSEGTRDTRNQVLPLLQQLSSIPFDQASGLFQIEEFARRVADQDILRRQQGFTDTQNQFLNQIIAFLSNTPLNENFFGPSTMSQLASVLGGIGDIIPF